MNNHNNLHTSENSKVIYRTFNPSHYQALSKNELPREQLLSKGPAALSDHELLSIILNVGIRGKNVYILARDLLDLLDNEKDIPQVHKLVTLTGLGKAKACTIMAMLEFGRRRWGPTNIKIANPEDAFRLICHHADRRQEKFLCISLNGAHEVLAVRIVTTGLVNRTLVHPREVFSDPLTDRACAVLVAHSHPSGQLSPSDEDNAITCNLKTAADILGLNFLDHIIFSSDAYFSYAQKEKLLKGNSK